MRIFRKMSVGFLLAIGLIFLMVPAYVLAKKDATPQDRDDAIAGLILGLPAVALGGLQMRGLARESQQEESDRLHSIFYRQLQEGKGYITLMRFAMAAKLPATVAQQYLDQKAKEFYATFDVSEEGGLFYKFNDFATLPLESAAPRYWTLGSMTDEVLRIQGTPTRVVQSKSCRKAVFYYGNSKVCFKKGRVTEYHNIDNNLKVCVEARSPINS